MKKAYERYYIKCSLWKIRDILYGCTIWIYRVKEYWRYRSVIRKIQETILVVCDVQQIIGGTEDVL